MSVIKVNTAFKYLLAVGWSQPILIQDTIMSIFPIHIKRQHIGSFKWSGWDNLLPKLVNYPIESQLQQHYKVDTIISIEDEEADPREYVIFSQLV